MMNRQTWTSLYASLILCSLFHSAVTLPPPASTEHAQLFKETSKESGGHEDEGKIKLEHESDKRGWKDNTMQVWGKRSDIFDEAQHEHRQSSNGNIKRKWETNNMPVWGKRTSEDKNNFQIREYEELSKNEGEKDKRKWGSNSMTVWGKRSDARDESIDEYSKRKWGSNSMTVWGKRAAEFHHAPSSIPLQFKRKWGDNSMNVWGKRFSPDSEAVPLNSDAELEFERMGADKRKWSDNTMQVWGKRGDSEPNNHHSKSKRSIRSYDDPIDSDIWRFLPADSRLSSNNYELPKRSWETNTMPVWGKRSYIVPQSLAVEFDNDLRRSDNLIPALYSYRLAGYGQPQKRAWSSENELRVWG